MRGVCIALACTLLFTAAGADFTPGEVPGWVILEEQREDPLADIELNLIDVSRMNEEGQQYDLIQYGDSLTAAMRDNRDEVWDELLPPGEVLATPLGMGGSTVEELAYRILYGGEAPTLPPRVVVLLIGYNNARYAPATDPAEMIDWLLQWFAHNWPTTRLALSALLPNAYIDPTGVSARYRGVAARRGVLFFDCGAGLDPNSTTQFLDGTHLSPEGERVWLTCMRGQVAGLLDGSSYRSAGAVPAPAPAAVPEEGPDAAPEAAPAAAPR